MFSIYDGVLKIVGPKETINELKALVAEKDKARLVETCDGAYASITTSYWWDLPTYEWAEKYPQCEFFISHGLGKYGGCQTDYSKPGESTWIQDNVETHSDGTMDREWNDDIDFVLFQGKYNTSTIEIHLKNGNPLCYSQAAPVTARFEELKNTPLTLSFLANACCNRLARAKRREFAESMRSTIGNLDQITRIVVRDTVKKGDIPKATAKMLPDPSLSLFVYSYSSVSAECVFDFAANTLTKTEKTVVTAPQFADSDFSYTEYPVSCNQADTVDICGIAGKDQVDLSFLPKDEHTCICTMCLSDNETIVVPETAAGKVTGLDIKCFINLKNTKKVILPNTITSFGTGNFTGCKKLKSVVFADAPDSDEDLILRKKATLKGLITLRDTYTVPEDITEIDKFAFSNCPKLKRVVLHSGVKRLLNDALAGCKTLKTIVLPDKMEKINITALILGNIKEIVLADGRSIAIHDPYMLDALTQSEGVFTFSYKTAAQNLKKASGEVARFKIAKELLLEHTEALAESLSDVAEFVLQYSIAKGDSETISNVFERKLPLKLDLNKLAEQANRAGKTDLAAMILSFRGEETVEAKTVMRTETPAPRIPWQKYIKVRFENGKAYSYFCSFDVKVGDKVFVPGKMAGMPGEVIELIEACPSGRAAAFTLSVESAFNVTEVDVNNFDL